MNPILWIHVALVLAADTEKTLYCPIPAVDGGGEYEAVSAYFTPDGDGAVTADATNYTVVTLKNGATSLWSRATDVAGGALVAGTQVALTITAATAKTAFEFTAGTDQLTIAVTMPGTGAVFKGIVAVGFRRKQASAYAT